MPIEKKRIQWIDSLKGMLLIFITFSHFGYLPKFVNVFIKPTGIVWVPCFFFLSGLLFSSNRYPKFIDYLKNKTKTLFLPYLGMSLLFLLFDWNIYLQPKIYLPASLSSIFTGSGPAKASPLWFIFTLYCISLMYFMIDKWIPSLALKTLAILLFSFLGYVCFLQGVHLPIRLEVAFSALTFLGIGNLYKEKLLEGCRLIASHKLIGILIVSLLFYISKIAGAYNFGGILGQNKINNYVFFYISSFSGIIAISFLTFLVWQLTNNIFLMNWIFKILNYVSRNALPILATQCYIIFIVHAAVGFGWIQKCSEQIEFIVKTIVLACSMYLLIIPFFSNKLYFILGKEKQSWKSLLIIK